MKIRKFLAVSVLVLSSFAASNVAPSKAELEAMYDKAFREFDSNNFSEALKQLDAIDARQPDLAESQNLRGVILMREGIYDKAEAALHEALRIDPKFWNARFNLAEIPFLKKDWTEARKRFQELLSNNVSELQGEAAQLIQYKILLTYLLEGKDNMVDSILAKFELSPETPAVHYANAAIALQHKNSKEAKDWIAAAEKNFSPQLTKLFAESLYEVGWLEKQAGQTRAALELTTPAERAAKAKAFARSRFEQAQQAYLQRNFAAARKFIDEADGADPNQTAILNLRGEILAEQKEFDLAEAAFKKAAKLDPKFREAQYNLAQLPFKKKDYPKARERFEALFSQTPGGDKNQAAQLIKFKIYMTLLLEGKESRAQKMMEQFQFTGDTPALYYAQAAWEFKHNNPNKATDWITSAKKIYSPSLNVVFADAFYDLGWMQSPVTAGSPGPATEAAGFMAAQTEASPAIEPSPIPGISVAANKRAKEAAPEASPVIAGIESAASRAPAAAVVSTESIAAGTPAKPEDIPTVPSTAFSPTVETTPAAVPAIASNAPVKEFERPAAAEKPTAEDYARFGAKPPVAAASATPATALAPSHVRDLSQPTLGETLSRFARDSRVWLVPVLALAGLLALALAIVPEIRKRMANVPVYRRPVPATGPRLENGNGAPSAQQKVMKNLLTGGPRQISLQLKASEPSLRRAVTPMGKPMSRAAVVEPPVVEPTMTEPAETVVHREPEPAVIPPAPEFQFAPFAGTSSESSVGPVIEQGATAGAGMLETVEPIPPPIAEPFVAPSVEQVAPSVEPVAASLEPVAVAESVEALAAVAEPVASSVETVPIPAEPVAAVPEMPAQPAWVSPISPVQDVANYQVAEPEVVSEMEPIGQGQPVPYEISVGTMEPSTAESAPAPPVESTPPVWADFAGDTVIDALQQPVETPSFTPEVASTEPSVLQSTIPETMPEPIQTQTAPVIRTPATGGTPQPASAMQTAVQLTFSFEIASMQLTPTFKMGALQLRPLSKVVTMRLAPSQHPQPAMNLQVTFEIAKIQPTGGGLGTVRLAPSQQQRPTVVGSPSFTVAGLQLVSNFEAAPVQLTPSQSAAVLVTSSFQIATVEFSPSFEIASIVLNSNSKQVAVQLPGGGSIEGAPMFEIANLQLGPAGEIGMMQINLLGQGGPRRA